MAYRANLFDFGAVAGAAGGANAAANDAAFLAALAAPEMVIEVEPELFEIGETIRHNAHGKKFVGVDGSDCFGTPSHGTRLKWTGPAGGEMVSIAPTVPGSDLIAPGFDGFELDGGGIAGRALSVKASRRPHANGIHVMNMDQSGSTIAVFMAAGDTVTGDVNCTYRGSFKGLSINVTGAAHGLMLDGTPGAGNATFNSIHDIHVVHENGIAFYLRGCDDNHLYNVAASRLEGGTGITVLFDGLNKYCVGNAIHGLQCGAHPAGSATTIYSRGSKARQNAILFLSGVDNRPQVVIDQGSELYYYFVGSGYTPTLAAEKALHRMPKRTELTY